LSIWHTDQLQVITVMMGSAGYKAGIYAGDLITTITREVDSLAKPLKKPEVIPTKGLLTGRHTDQQGHRRPSRAAHPSRGRQPGRSRQPGHYALAPGP
jgi:hypothetical protein